jgi:hypothetical protein
MRENFVAGSLGSRCIAKKRNVTGFNEVRHRRQNSSVWRELKILVHFWGRPRALRRSLRTRSCLVPFKCCRGVERDGRCGLVDHTALVTRSSTVSPFVYTRNEGIKFSPPLYIFGYSQELNPKSYL